LLEHLERLGDEFKVALLVEPFTLARGIDPKTLDEEKKGQILDYVWDNFYSAFSDVVLHWEGRPLLVQWYPMDLGEDERFTIRTLPGTGSQI